MKGCIIKPPVSLGFTLSSVKYRDADLLLDAFVGKVCRFSLCVELQADCWVVGDGNIPPGTFVETVIQCESAETLEAYRQVHKTVPLATIPWDQYDVVITSLPIVPDNVIRRHPNILWCYFSISHITKLHKCSLERPYGRYDLFLDHFMASPDLRGLPQAVCFPYPVNLDLMRNLICPTHEPYVFVDSRLIMKDRGIVKHIRKHSPLPIRWTTPPSQRKRTATGFIRKISVGEDIDKGRQFLEKLGSCKYLLLARKEGFVGQLAAEAAALGVIVISGPGQYPSRICHPRCLVKAVDIKGGLRTIGEIEAHPDLQQEILVYQEQVIRETFWDEPLATLHKALEMKRAGRSISEKPG